MSDKRKLFSNLIVSDFIEDKFDHKLRQTTPLRKLPDPLKSNLKALYSSKKDLNANLLACLINGLYTENLETFLFSVRELLALIKADNKSRNLKRKTLNDKEFSTFKSYLIKRKIIVVESEATPFEAGKKGGMAAFCLLVHPGLLKLIADARSVLDTPKKVDVSNIQDHSDDDYESPEQVEFEKNLVINPIHPDLVKEMRSKTKIRTNKNPSPSKMVPSSSTSPTGDPELDEIYKIIDEMEEK